MSKKTIYTDAAPEPIGPYSQAIQFNNFVFTSGQIALEAKSGQLCEGGVEEQTRLVLENIKSVLSASGASLDTVLKTTIYLKDMSDFAKVNEIYSEYFGFSKPARSTIEVSKLPKDVLVEIDCIAYVN